MSVSVVENGVSNLTSMKLFDYISDTVRRSPSLPMTIFLMILIIPNVILAFTEPVSVTVSLLNILFPLSIYYLLLTISPNFGRTVWLFFPVIFLAAFQIVLLWLYGRSVIAVDMFLNLVTTNPGEVGELLSNMLPAIALVVVIYIPALWIGTALAIRHTRINAVSLRHHRRIALASVITTSVFALTLTATSPGWNARNDIFPANAIYNARLAIDHTVKVSRHNILSDNFRFDAHSALNDSTPLTIVMVIGETSRADHWQLNGYKRATNPRLSRITTGQIFSFANTLSESNTTHKSVPLMLSHLTPATYGDSIYCVKSIITAFKEAGFATTFISNQRRNHSFIDFFGNEADSTLFIRESDGLGLSDTDDLRLLDCLDNAIAGKTSPHKLVVLHTYGSHFSYRDRYPDAIRTFTDDGYTEIDSDNRSRLINAYDNTIVLTDSLLSGIIDRLSKYQAAMIYTSDHGEDILDDSRGLFLHASPCPSFYQIHVPFIVWLSDSFKNTDEASALSRNVTRRVSSNSSYPMTALDLAKITSPRFNRKRSVANPDYHPAPLLYLNDHNDAVALEKSGLTDYDLPLLHRLTGCSGIVRTN